MSVKHIKILSQARFLINVKSVNHLRSRLETAASQNASKHYSTPDTRYHKTKPPIKHREETHTMVCGCDNEVISNIIKLYQIHSNSKSP